MTSNLPMEDMCNRLRTLVQDCLAKHLYDSAIFYADKLTTMSNQAPRDAYLLAQVTQVNKMHQPLSSIAPPGASNGKDTLYIRYMPGS